MTRGEIWKDFFKKVIVPVLLTAFLFYWGTKIFTQNGETNYGCFAAFLSVSEECFYG